MGARGAEMICNVGGIRGTPCVIPMWAGTDGRRLRENENGDEK